MAEKKYVSLSKLSLYDEKIKALIDSKDADTLSSAKAYADGLADNYEKAGAIATAKTELQGKIDAVDLKADGAQAAADAAQKDVDALETLVGTLPEGTSVSTVVGYVDAKTAGIATDAALEELGNQVSGLQTAVQGIKDDYLTSDDETELKDLITAEASTARAAEQANASAIKTISDDYLKSADKTTLEASIATAKKAGDDAQADIDAFLAAAEVGDAAVDTLKEIQDYITSDGQAAATMTANIDANATAISDLEDYVGDIPEEATATDVVTYVQEVVGAEKTRATGVEDDLNTRLAAVESAVGESGSVADDIATAKDEAIDAAAADATSKDEALETKITAAYKAYADAEDEKIESRVATLESASATHALASDLTALASRVTTAEGEIDTLQTEMDAVEAKAAANETAIGTLNTAVAGKVAQSDFDTLSAKVTANETAIASFVEVSEEEVLALFQQ